MQKLSILLTDIFLIAGRMALIKIQTMYCKIPLVHGFHGDA